MAPPTGAGWLDGTRVLELAGGRAAAYAGHLLAGLGAEVWKIEPPAGDSLRHEGPFLHDTPDPETSAAFLFYGAGKRSVRIDPDSRADGRLLRRLAAASEIILADAAGARRLRARGLAHRGAVVVVVTPFGLTGPYRDAAASDLTLQCLMGLAHITGEPDQPPLKMGLPIAETASGQLAAALALAGLWRRRRSGRGLSADLSIWEAALTAMEHAPMHWSYRRFRWRRRGNLGGLAGWGIYPCRDGYVGVISGLADTFREFVRMVGLDDPKFQSIASRTRFADEMHAAIFEWLGRRTREQAVREAQRRGLPFGFLHDVADLLASPQLRARRFFRRATHPRAGRLVYAAGPFRSNAARWRVARAPLLDEHRRAAIRLARVGAASGPPVTVEAPAASGRLPLAGVRVLEMAVVWAGPLCGRVLAELGAELVKLETARKPDLIRGPARPSHAADGCYPAGDPGADPWNRHAYFNDRSRNKLGLCVDLDTPAGRALARDLAARCDVVVENFSPGALAAGGLDYESLRALRPDIVYLSMPSQGLTGPERDYVGYGATNDLTSGLLSVTGYEDGRPQNAGINVSDPIAAFHGAVAVTAALVQRQATGRGQWIDLSQRESTAHLMGPALLDHAMNGRVARPAGNREPGAGPCDVYRCAGDDAWLAISVRSDEEWESLCAVAGEALAPAFAALGASERVARRDEIDAAISRWTAREKRSDLWRRLRDAGVAAAPAYAADALMADPHLRARRFWAAVTHPSAGRRLYPGSPWRVEGRRAPQTPAPRLGEHNREVCARILGLSDAEIARLEGSGVLATRPRDA